MKWGNRFNTHKKEFYDNGQLKYKKSNNNGFIEEEYYSQNGNLTSKEKYKKSKLIDRVFYNLDGSIQSHFYIENGNEVTETYYENGELKEREVHVDDLTNYIAYYDNGNIEEEGQLKDCQLFGMSKRYYHDGTIMSECEYDMGTILCGKFYDERGRIEYDIKYKNGFKDEECEYRYDGTLISKTVYTDEYKMVTDYESGGKIFKYKIKKIGNSYKGREYESSPE